MDDKTLPITAGLRDGMRHFTNFHQEKRVEMDEKVFTDMCDAIDSIHGRVCSELDDARHEVDWMHAELHGWETDAIKMPLDRDGVPIRVGDVMEYTDKPTEPLTVSYIELEKEGWWVFAGGMGRRPDKYRHHHAPTVEDVLTEFGIDWEHENDCEDRAALLKEYAAKLREVMSND